MAHYMYLKVGQLYMYVVHMFQDFFKEEAHPQKSAPKLCCHFASNHWILNLRLWKLIGDL